MTSENLPKSNRNGMGERKTDDLDKVDETRRRVCFELHQWGKSLRVQERLLQGLAHSNTERQNTVATDVAADFDHTIRHGRHFSRNWARPPSWTSSQMTTKKRSRERRMRYQSESELHSWPIGIPIDENVSKITTRITPGDAAEVRGVTSCSVSYMNTLENASLFVNNITLPQGPSFEAPSEQAPAGLQREKKLQDIEPNTLKYPKIHDTRRSGWFWGGYRTAHAFGPVSEPGRGAVGTFWRWVDSKSKSSIKGAIAPGDEMFKAETGQNQHEKEVTFRGTPHHIWAKEQGERCCFEDARTASIENAVRTARDRVEELERLFVGISTSSKQDILTEADSAVFASQNAVSCISKRLLELELQVGAVKHSTDDTGTAFGNDEAIVNEDKYEDRRISSQISESNMKLQLAQTLLLNAFDARARLKKYFWRFDMAARVLQTGIRSYLQRCRSEDATKHDIGSNACHKARSFV